MACALAKIHAPAIDIRKPYTEIKDPLTDLKDPQAYGGRGYDEDYLSPFVFQHNLPCNPTTAWLTPAFRNRDTTLVPELNMVGRPPQVYKATLRLLTDVHEERISAEDLLAETLRRLLIIRNEKVFRMETLFAELQSSGGVLPLSSEDIIALIERHLMSPNASRLPVLVIAAAYEAAKDFLGEQALKLEGHNAADKQTGSPGDIAITMLGSSDVVTVYEMKAKRVTQNDIDVALQKIVHYKVNNYIIITTEAIDNRLQEYARSLYSRTGGTEFVVLDCLGFIRHFLHLFHRIRIQFLDAYQRILLAEPESAVRQTLKEVFLSMRLDAEAAYAISQEQQANDHQS